MPLSYALVARNNSSKPTNRPPPGAATSTGDSDHDPVFEILSTALNTHNNFEPDGNANGVTTTIGIWNIVFAVKAIPPPFIRPNDYGRFYEITRLGPTYDHNEPITATVQVKLAHDGTALLARKGMEWTDLGTALLPLFPPPKEEVIGIGSSFWYQSYVWVTSGKKFFLLSLARELRDMIYDACSTFTFPFHWFYGWNFLPNACRYPDLFYGTTGPIADFAQTEFYRLGRIINGAGPAMSLLLSNKQVSREFKECLWKNMDFRFTTFECLELFARAPPAILHSGTSLRTVSWVSIHLDMKEWLTAFGIPFRKKYGIEEVEDTPFVLALKDSKLSHLTMFIQHEGRSFQRRYSNTFFNICTKLLRGLLLWHAKEHIKQISRIEIEGCIAPDMNAKFQKILSDDRMGMPSSITEFDFFGPPDRILMFGFTSWLDIFPWEP